MWLVDREEGSFVIWCHVTLEAAHVTSNSASTHKPEISPTALNRAKPLQGITPLRPKNPANPQPLVVALTKHRL